ncbi:hypothetical protein GGX14DRAFT_576712 [Mycena pura]|uniref:Uncharacterized protein n=1 Tax=Mycena pura TaxID=153505 RepID=A0AAD6Y2Z3_9AGAR|nr:hypothetical protein GGX14DRAFT_576712 [Mycena pura]
MTNTKSTPKSQTGRPVRPSTRQKQTNENRAEDVAKKQKKQDTAKRSAAKKAKRADNDAQADALRDTTNTPAESALSLEQQIAVLKTRLDTSDAKNRRLSARNKKLRRHSAPTTDSTEIIPIPKPKGKFSIQCAMGLSDDKTEFTKLQAAIHALATSIEAKVDFDVPWSQQDPMTVAKVLRVAAERYEYLCAKRFPRHWATQAILQRYINSVRAYNSGKANPASGVSRRRERRTAIGRRAAEERRTPQPSLSPPPDADQMDVDDGHVSDPKSPGSRDSTPSDEDSDGNANSRTQDHNTNSDEDDDEYEYDDDDEELPVAED